MVKKTLLLLIPLVLLFITPFLHAETYAISNSQNWQDVYSTLLYSSLKGIGGDFLTSTSDGTIILNGIQKDNSILVISSRNSPYIYNYPDIIRANGFTSADELTVGSANLELIDSLPDIKNFVIVGDSYGYNAVAVAPYAVQKNSWVFLANSVNINEIDSILSRRNLGEVLIYGYVDRSVRDTLSKYNPRIIDSGDRFNDNIEIVKEYLALNPTKQVLLTNGEFIEKQLMLGTEPNLFTGTDNVPSQIGDYLKNSPLEIGILIGNDLIGTATNIKETTGISVMVKFARGARTQTNGVSAVEGLDLFPVPTPTLNLSISSLEYNIVNSQLELTYKSSSNIPAYFKGVITVNGNKVGDANAVFIAPGNYKTVTYNVDGISGDNLKADVFTLYGESVSSLDKILQKTVDISSVQVLDNCEINITDAKYNKQKKELMVQVKNNAGVDCWVNLEIPNLKIGYEQVTAVMSSPEKISAKKTKTISIHQEMTDSDLAQNPFVEVDAQFGERETSLVKSLKTTLELKTETFSSMSYVIMTVLAIIIILLITIFILRKKDEEGY